VLAEHFAGAFPAKKPVVTSMAGFAASSPEPVVTEVFEC
jgi:hypothetical protein